MKLNVVIGRFQPMHNGHVELIQHALNTADTTLVLIGCSEKDGYSKKNPFTFEERSALIHEHFSNADIVTFPLTDISCDKAWVELTRQAISRLAGDKYSEISFVCCNKDSETTASNNLLSGYYSTEFLEFKYTLNATDLREKFLNGDLKYITGIPHVTQQFLAQVEEKLIHDSQTIVSMLEAGETSINTAAVSADISLPDWKTSYLYSYIDLRLVSCFKCSLYKTPQQFGQTTTQEVYESLVVCKECRGNDD